MMQPAGHLRGRLRGSDPDTKVPAKPRSRRNLQGGVSCSRLSTPHPLHGPDPLSRDLLPAPAPEEPCPHQRAHMAASKLLRWGSLPYPASSWKLIPTGL